MSITPYATSHDITFCLISCGELSESKCREAISPFVDQVCFIEVRNTFPQIAALRKMSEMTTTEYLIPLDADMVLYPDAWDRIRISLDKHSRDPKWASILFPLHDTLTDRKILALKILRMAALRSIPFEENPTPDISHFGKLQKEGWTCITNYLEKPPIGDHVVKGKHFCYNKYRDVYMTYRMYQWEWDGGVFLGGNDLQQKAKAHFDYFLQRYLLTDDDDYLWCIAGMMDGITSPEERGSKTLENRTLKIDKSLAIDEFMRWHTLSTINSSQNFV